MILALLLIPSVMDSELALLRTWNAVCWQESRGDPRAYNAAEDAAGIAQIRPIMLQDANRIIGYKKYTLADRWNPQKSFEIFKLVVLFYYPNGTPEQWCKMWNGGPKGPKKASTQKYWEKCKKVLDKQKNGQ